MAELAGLGCGWACWLSSPSGKTKTFGNKIINTKLRFWLQNRLAEDILQFSIIQVGARHFRGWRGRRALSLIDMTGCHRLSGALPLGVRLSQRRERRNRPIAATASASQSFASVTAGGSGRLEWGSSPRTPHVGQRATDPRPATRPLLVSRRCV